MSAVNSASRNSLVKAKMEVLAQFIQRLESEEIWALLDSLFPTMNEETKEDMHDMILVVQEPELNPDDFIPADQFFKELEAEKVLKE